MKKVKIKKSSNVGCVKYAGVGWVGGRQPTYKSQQTQTERSQSHRHSTWKNLTLNNFVYSPRCRKFSGK